MHIWNENFTKHNKFFSSKKNYGKWKHNKKPYNFQKEHFKETQLKEKKNKVFSEITNQTRKNEFENDEKNLQIQYYKTIIEQKNVY